MEIKGTIDPDYQAIADVFAENFSRRGEIGASLCIYHHHKPVLDIWGGFKDPQQSQAWDAHTVVPFFSTTKAVAASCLALCHSRGLFRYTDRVADHWKAFAAQGKERITIEQLLQHRAGLSATDKKLNAKRIKNREHLEHILAAQKPHWEPGAYQGYHVWNIGWYISAILARMDPQQRRLKEFVNEEMLPNISGEVRIGIEADYDMNKIARLKPFSKMKGLFAMPPAFVMELFKPWSLSFKSMLNPGFVSNHANFNKPQILQLEIGAGGGIGNARGLASMMDGLSNPAHSLFAGQQTLDYLKAYPQAPENGYKDIVFKQDAFRFHAGYMKPSGKHDFSANSSAFGGFGAGGSFVFTDPERVLTVAYTMNRMASEMMNMPRELAIRKAIWQTLNRKYPKSAGMQSLK